MKYVSSDKPSHVGRLKASAKPEAIAAVPQKNLVDLLLEDSVFHRQSVFIYADQTASFGVVLNKPIATIVPITIFRDGDDALRNVMQSFGWTKIQANKSIAELKHTAAQERHDDYHCHYDRSERNMLRAAAEIAARQPETVALYRNQRDVFPSKDMMETLLVPEEIAPADYVDGLPKAVLVSDTQRLRFVICPEGNAQSAGSPHVDSSGVMFLTSSTVVASHPQDKFDWGATTIHERVHAFDMRNLITHEHMDRSMEQHVIAEISFAESLMNDWGAHIPLDPQQREMVRQWQETIASLPLDEQLLLNPDNRKPDDPFFGQAAMARYVASLKTMIHLDSTVYPYEQARLHEFLPIFEEAARINNTEPLNPQSGSRQLCKILCKSLSDFSDTHYLPLLQQEHDKALAKGEFTVVNRPILRFNTVKRLHNPTNENLKTDEQERLMLLRNKLLRVMIEIDNFYPQPAVIAEKDTIVEDMRELYRQALDRKLFDKATPESGADMLVFREIRYTQSIIQKARAALEAGAGVASS